MIIDLPKRRYPHLFKSRTKRTMRALPAGQREAAKAIQHEVSYGDMPRPDNFWCVDCGRLAQCYDHRDYNWPLRVEPVCRRCNALRGPAIPLKTIEN